MSDINWKKYPENNPTDDVTEDSPGTTFLVLIQDDVLNVTYPYISTWMPGWIGEKWMYSGSPLPKSMKVVAFAKIWFPKY